MVLCTHKSIKVLKWQKVSKWSLSLFEKCNFYMFLTTSFLCSYCFNQCISKLKGHHRCSRDQQVKEELTLVIYMSGLSLMQQQMKCLLVKDYRLVFMRQRAEGNALSS